jgi:hypothetical protein
MRGLSEGLPDRTGFLLVPVVVVRLVPIVIVEVRNDRGAVLGGDGHEKRKDKSQDHKGLKGADAVRQARLRPPERELAEHISDSA